MVLRNTNAVRNEVKKNKEAFTLKYLRKIKTCSVKWSSQKKNRIPLIYLLTTDFADVLERIVTVSVIPLPCVRRL